MLDRTGGGIEIVYKSFPAQPDKTMFMTLKDFNQLDRETVKNELFSCCGSKRWVSLLINHFPFVSEAELLRKAVTIWYNECNKADWLESFTHHPMIGEVLTGNEKYAGQEQSGVSAVGQGLTESLVKANTDYKSKFGFIFIVCATGKTAVEMLRLIGDRLKNDPDEEPGIAMNEQQKITIIRLQKLLSDANFKFLTMSQITTHVLDTSIGKPGADISVKLMFQENDGWQTISQGITDKDGRINDLLPGEKKLNPGIYKLIFETGNYFNANQVKGFYPRVEIQFTINGDPHYHVPLLINPFGYSTYRGS